MNRAELQRLIRGIIVATVTPFDDDFEVDHGRMYELAQWWVENGLVEGRAVIKTCSIMGEMPSLADHEWPTVVRTVVQAVDGKVPVIGTIHGKDTKRSIDDALRAQDLGAVGLQVSAPTGTDPSQDDTLHYFEALSDAIEIGMMIYNTPWAPHGGIDTETFHKMADFEDVVAIKWCKHADYNYDDMAGLADIFNICDNSNQPGRCFRLGGKGFLDEQATANPAHELKVLELVEAGKYDEAQALWDSVSVPINRFYAKITERSGGSARVKKGVLALMGHPVGSARPPSLPLSEDEMAELRDILVGVGWPVQEQAGAKVGALA